MKRIPKELSKLEELLQILGGPNAFPTLEDLVKIRANAARALVDINNFGNDINDLKEENIKLIKANAKMTKKYMRLFSQSKVLMEALKWTFKRINLKYIKKGKSKKNYVHTEKLIQSYKIK